MEVRHCPSCGSGSIDVSSFSAEYMRSTTHSCEDCDWSYTRGSGMGTGSGNSGVHPRNTGPSGGQWCSTCEYCARPGYCGCVEGDQTGFCEDCANYSEQSVDEMVEVCTYFGRGVHETKFPCSICGEKKSEYKVI